MADQLTIHERVKAIDHLGQIADSLNEAAQWLVRNDADAAGELTEQAAEKLAAACWILGSRLRPREPGHLAADTLAAMNGRPDQAATIAGQLAAGASDPAV